MTCHLQNNTLPVGHCNGIALVKLKVDRFEGHQTQSERRSTEHKIISKILHMFPPRGWKTCVQRTFLELKNLTNLQHRLFGITRWHHIGGRGQCCPIIVVVFVACPPRSLLKTLPPFRVLHLLVCFIKTLHKGSSTMTCEH